RGVLETGEDAAAAVVDDHEIQFGAGLLGADEQPGEVVERGEIADEHAGAAGDALGRACEGEAACHRGGAVDAGEAAVRDHARGGGAGELLEVAYEARGAEDQQVPVTGRL